MNKEKALIFDSGILINLSLNGLLYILPEIKKIFKGKLLITHSVKYEVIDRPINVQRFELEALRIKDLLDSGVLELPEAIKVDRKTIEKETFSLLDKANHFIWANNRWIQIVSDAEISCLALYDECLRRGIEPLVAIDERTTRLLVEDPVALEKLLSIKLHAKAKLVEKEYKIFSKYKLIRSPELIYFAHKKNLLHLKGPKVLEAAIYASKFHGSAISWEEINELKKL